MCSSLLAGSTSTPTKSAPIDESTVDADALPDADADVDPLAGYGEVKVVPDEDVSVE